jgi:hypothetical protein
LRSAAENLDYSWKKKNFDHQKLRKQGLVEVGLQ